MSTENLIPPSYEDREQALVKHQLLERYVEKLFLIVGLASKGRTTIELCYVDCFAGPWGDSSEEMDSTSIAISLRTLDGCRQTLASLGVYAKVRALFVERDPVAFARLRNYLRTSTPSGIKSEALNGDFVALRHHILEWAGKDSFVFFFIDPKGFTPIGVPTLHPLLERPRSEFLINLMYEHLNRVMAMKDWEARMEELIAAKLDLQGCSPDEREDWIVHTYRASLKKCVPSKPGYPARAAHVRVMHPLRERPKYHLVYITSHPKGVVEFMKMSEPVAKLQDQVRAVKRDTKRERATGTSELFGPGELVMQDPKRPSEAAVDAHWRDYLRAGPRLIGYAEFADILEETGWFESELQGSLVRLIKAGRIINKTADAQRRHKRPLHFDCKGGEALEWVGN